MNLVSRFGDSQLNFDGILEDFIRHLLDFGGHSGGKHQDLRRLWDMRINLHNIVIETHIEHSVGLVEDKERDFGEIDITHAEVSEETPGSCDNDICTHLEAFALLIVGISIGAAIDSDAAHGHKIGEALQLTVDLLRQLASRRHDDAVYGVGREIAGSQTVDHRQKIGGSLAGAGLCACHHIFAVDHGRYRSLLYRSTLIEMHIPKPIQHIVVG